MIGHITSLGIKVVYGLNLFVDIPVKSDISYQTSITDYIEWTIVKDAEEEISHFGSIQNKKLSCAYEKELPDHILTKVRSNDWSGIT